MTMIKRFAFVFALLAALASVLPADVLAQQGPGAFVTGTGQRGDAGNVCGSNTSATVVSLTLGTPGVGLSNYITMLQVYSFGSASTATTAPSAHTISGISSTATGGANLLVGVHAGAGGAGTTGWVQPTSPSFTTPIKGLAATTNVISGGTAIANANQAAVYCGYVAP